ncbi:MAG: hypothetical protein A2169_02285 [Deltaproteobacteria bacterium RBG_13_47_9]|nr:MAG: hypothetical protein A2169_02285 [Deltaproteobacteria bacterium RBG_13_47_9]
MVTVLLQAEPEALEIDLIRTAVIVVDMQNAFVSKGGMFDLWGFDVSSNQKMIEPIKRLNSAARGRGCKIIYVAHRYSPDFREAGNPLSANRYKSRSIKDYIEYPEWRDKFIVRETWGADIVEELAPQGHDILIEKTRYSAFFNTNLDTILRTYDLKYLIFVGVATNMCVEASMRDAYNLEYFPILVSDATMNSGPPFMQEATLFNVKTNFGWVTTTENVIKLMPV